jgi:hypothetical protein
MERSITQLYKEAIKSKATQHCWIGLMEMKKRRRRGEDKKEEKLEGRCNQRYYIRGADLLLNVFG